MNNLSIKGKLYSLTILISIVFIIIGATAIYSLSIVNSKSSEITGTWMPRIGLSANVNTLTSDYRIAQFTHIVSTTPEAMANADKKLADLEKQIDDKFKEYEQYVVDENRKKVVRQTIQNWNDYKQSGNKMITLSRQNKTGEATIIMLGEASKQFDAVSADILEIQEYSFENGARVSAEGDEVYNSFSKILTIIIVAAIVFLIAVMVFFIRWLTYRLSTLVRLVSKIADGDLREKAVISNKDELGKVGLAINTMIDNLVKLVGQIQNSSQQVAASSQELTASAEQSAEVTQQIAKSVTDVSEMSNRQLTAVDTSSAAVQEISAGIEQTTATFGVAAENSRKAVDTAKNGNTIINGAVKQMASIEATVNASAEVVTKLGQRSKEIGAIIDTISGIAGQTNLLALNAAIEAARAGEQGKGFAVVAEEVRKLAEQSQDAAKQIGELISSIQVDTDSAVAAMNNGTSEVRTGTAVVNQAGEAFTQILETVNTVSEQSSDIAATMEELAQGTQRIVNASQEIDDSSRTVATEAETVSAATEEQAAAMEQMASGSRSLAHLAQELQEATTKFKL